MPIQDLVKKNSKIRFRVSHGRIWLNTLIDQVEEGRLVLAFPVMYTGPEIVLSKRMTCRIETETEIYRFDAEIEKIKIDFPQQIVIKLVNEPESCGNVRESERFTSLILGEITKISSGEKEVCVINDLSLSGMQAITRIKLEDDEEVQMRFFLPFRNVFDSMVSAHCKYVWSNSYEYSRYEYGLQILNLDEYSHRRISKFLHLYGKE